MVYFLLKHFDVLCSTLSHLLHFLYFGIREEGNCAIESMYSRKCWKRGWDFLGGVVTTGAGKGETGEAILLRFVIAGF